MRNLIPSYLNTKKSVFLLVLSTALFAELFILFFQPFESRGWVDSDWQFLLWVTIIVLVAMGVIALSRTIMYHVAKRHAITYVDYAIWIIAEMSAMAFIYAVFPLIVLRDFSMEMGLTFFTMFREALTATAFILLIPYTIITLWIALKAKSTHEEQLAGEAVVPLMFHFYDEKGDLKLCVKSDMVYFLEASDNYVTICYVSNDKVEKMMIRNSLRNIEWRFNGLGLIRCHRSYIINIKRVQVVRCQDGDVMVEFGDVRVPNIPVSKGYAEKVMGAITQ